jgi:uncharacterized protein
VAYFTPQRVIVFGSAARGDAGPDGDIDLLVVVDDDTPAERVTLAAGYDARRPYRRAADVIPMRRSTFERKRRVVGSLAATADAEGIVVYERARRTSSAGGGGGVAGRRARGRWRGRKWKFGEPSRAGPTEFASLPPLRGKDRMGGRAMPRGLALLAWGLGRNATNAERRLWQGLRRKEVGGFRFRRQVALGGFIADFASFDARLIIDPRTVIRGDGATHSTDEELARDAARSAALVAQGFALLRFTNDEVFHNLDGVLETISLKLIELRPRIRDSTV